MAFSDLLITALIGCIATFLLTPLAIRSARRLSIIDYPHGHKVHPAPTPLLGGTAVIAGAAFGGFWIFIDGANIDLDGLPGIGIGLLIVLIAGLIDDIRSLSPRSKLIWQCGGAGVACLYPVAFDVNPENSFGGMDWLFLLVCAVWIVAVTNAINFLDNMNGLCAGLSAIAAFSLAVYKFHSGDPTIAMLGAALGGACIGFIPYNWPRARIFLGDAGSMAIGFALASLSVMSMSWPTRKLSAPEIVVPLVVLSVPVLDLFRVVVVRVKQGHPPWLGDHRHISHRLVKSGLNPTVTVIVLWAVGAIAGISALLLTAPRS